MAVLQLAESVDSRKEIKDIGERAKEEKRRELIFKILTFVFMALPFVGEAIGPLVDRMIYIGIKSSYINGLLLLFIILYFTIIL